MAKDAELTSRQKVVLVFLDSEDRAELDPIRIMKGLFLIAAETPREWLSQESRYDFEPYSYGPCAFEIYSDLQQLAQLGFVRTKEVPGRTWRYYALTPKGRNLAARLSESMNPDAVTYFRNVRDFVRSTSFRQLLSAIYHHYPQYAVNSVFKL